MGQNPHLALITSIFFLLLKNVNCFYTAWVVCENGDSCKELFSK